MRPQLSDRSRQRLRSITTILATALVIAPAAALAGHQFNDVPNSNVFHDDIDWMRDNGVTRGCNPPTNDEYCPDEFVTREQMAAFMHRLETQGVFLRPGEGSGGDADTVDGKHASDFLGVNAKAANADKLDGKNSTSFLPSSGETIFQLRDWDLNSPDELTLLETLNQFRITPGSTTSALVYADPDLPKQFFGVTMAVKQFDLCYTTAFGGILTDVQPGVFAEDGDSSGAFVDTAFDSTNRTDNACRTYSFDSPVPLTTDRYFSVGVGVDVSATDARVFLTRATVTLVPA